MKDLYSTLYAAYRWLVPPQFNIADVCVHRWASTTHEGRNVAIYYEDAAGQQEVWTYARVSETAQRLANGLQRMQVSPGDRVAIVMTQRPEAVVALIAALSVGAVAVPLSNQASAAALGTCLRDADARVAIVDALCAARVHQAQCPQLKQIVGLDFANEDAMSWRTLLARQPAVCKTHPTVASSPALLLYPDEPGPTPTGVLLAHAALIGALPGFVAAQNWFPQQGDMFWSPDWDACGHWLGGVLAALYFGRPVVAAPKGISPQQAMALLTRYRVSNAYLPASLALHIAQEPGLLERHSDALTLRALAVQGLPLPERVAAHYQSALGLRPNQMWSQPEATAVMGDSHLKWPGRSGSLGRAYPGHRVGVLDAHGQPCPVGTVGMLAVHRQDIHQFPDPVLPLGEAVASQSCAGDWVALNIRAHVDKQGYIWPVLPQSVRT